MSRSEAAARGLRAPAPAAASLCKSMMLALLCLSAGAAAAAPRCARPTWRVVAPRNATRCAGAAPSFAALRALRPSARRSVSLIHDLDATMPGAFYKTTTLGAGLVLGQRPTRSSLACAQLVARGEVSHPVDLRLLVEDVPEEVLLPQLEDALAYQMSAPKGDFGRLFLDDLVPQATKAIKAATDLYSASKAMSDVSHLGVHLGGGYSQTVDLLDNKNLKVIPGVLVIHLAVGRRGDEHNSIFTSGCKTGVAIVESLRRVYAAAGYLPEIVVVQESWALNGCDMLGVYRSVKDDVVTYVVRVGPLYASSTCASLHAVDATGSSHAGTTSTSRRARSTRRSLRYGERCGRRPRASTCRCWPLRTEGPFSSSTPAARRSSAPIRAASPRSQTMVW